MNALRGTLSAAVLAMASAVAGQSAINTTSTIKAVTADNRVSQSAVNIVRVNGTPAVRGGILIPNTNSLWYQTDAAGTVTKGPMQLSGTTSVLGTTSFTLQGMPVVTGVVATVVGTPAANGSLVTTPNTNWASGIVVLNAYSNMASPTATTATISWIVSGQ